MEELVIALKKALATTFAFYLKTHNYHWNVTGPDFYQYHKLLEEIYEEVYGAVDTIAEQIRAMGSHVPGSLGRLSELSELRDEREQADALTMIARLYQDNQTVLSHIKTAYDAAEAAGNHGWSNFLAERQSAHKKHGWLLRATLAQ